MNNINQCLDIHHTHVHGATQPTIYTQTLHDVCLFVHFVAKIEGTEVEP